MSRFPRRDALNRASPTQGESRAFELLYVVGSGPAGLSSARALLASGHEVTMLDAGKELEPGAGEIVRRLAASEPDGWNTSDIEHLRTGSMPSSRGIPLKRIYGSDFPYRPAGIHRLIEESPEIGIRPSYARGGFSNVWGAGVLPYAEDELVGWPFSRTGLAPHFRAVLDDMPLAGRRDGLADAFPLYTDRLSVLRTSRQAERFLSDLDHNSTELRQRGFTFGRSRLGVRSRAMGDVTDCVHCGLCLYGCPYGLIYNSASTLRSLILEAPKFRYVPGVIVHRVRQVGETVIIEGADLQGSRRSFVGSRAFLACGALSTTRIVLESLGAYGSPLSLRDSQYFLLPLLRYRTVPAVASEKLHTLCQVFLRLRRPELGNHAIHLSVYTYNDLYRGALAALCGSAVANADHLTNPLFGRLLVVQGHLPSDRSSSIVANLFAQRNGEASILRLSSRDTDQTRRTIGMVQRELFRVRRLLRAIPLPLMTRVGKPGSGFYAGGGFPMRQDPGRLETDPLGRPKGFQRVHLVDASVFPSIAGTPITFTVMANAHRIASETARLLDPAVGGEK
ncbi:MAG: GMC family oxidoreductase [Acidobacteria bacterium]|nr:GMC family oxidoreductase [Acidobacteriota bacterium]MYJ06017.1 GMC family oxidoreductase [Acidobacteriota bacterium]